MFDSQLRILRRDRAARSGPATFLEERAMMDVVDHLALLSRKPDMALLIGAPSREMVALLSDRVGSLDVVEPSPVLAALAGAACVAETALELDSESLDLIVAMGTFDTVDELPALLHLCALALREGGMLIGVIPGAETLPRLRRAMRSADQVSGAVTPHVHPRIEPQALTGLLSRVGLANPVVEVDRVAVTYSDLWRLVADLRAMGATNILEGRSRTPLSRAAAQAAAANFAEAGEDGRTTEIFELLHFAAWKGEPAPVAKTQQ